MPNVTLHDQAGAFHASVVVPDVTRLPKLLLWEGRTFLLNDGPNSFQYTEEPAFVVGPERVGC